MRQVDTFAVVVDAFKTMLNDKKKDVMRVVGPAPMGGEYIDLVMDEQPCAPQCCAIRAIF